MKIFTCSIYGEMRRERRREEAEKEREDGHKREERDRE